MASEAYLSIFEAAEALAKENANSEPNIVAIYLFPAADEVRLLEVDQTALPSGEAAQAFYFAPDKSVGIPYPSGIAIIRPEEFGKIEPPEGWGRWSDAKAVFER